MATVNVHCPRCDSVLKQIYGDRLAGKLGIRTLYLSFVD
ncbi:hypothetical protein GNE01_28005 [Klebsiella sp. JL973]|nr:hypothetical protein F0332_21685 [Klebsiella grimontii]MTW43763.1 hypothetical protein [Klebsiella sp. JL973]